MKLVRKEILKSFNPENEITNPDIFTRKSEMVSDDGETVERKKFSEDGLFSPRIFGELDTEDSYSCGCGKFKGKVFEGLICDNPECTVPEVKLVEANIDKFGWINLKGTYIIGYISYLLIEKIIGRENLRTIMKTPNTITIDGDLDTVEIAVIQSSSPQAKYFHIGLEEFKTKYAEIMKYYFEIFFPNLILDPKYDLIDENELGTLNLDADEYARVYKILKTKERKIYSFLLDETHVFTDKIPVISTILRPAVRTADGLKMDELNNIYINMLKNVKILNEKTDIIKIIRDSTLESLQAQYFHLSEEILENIKSKNGLIRNQICGTRINFSARNIISPARAGYKVDEISMPYMTFLFLYKFEIINIISKIKGLKFVDANEVWYQATLGMNEEIYMIMKKMITDEEIGILLNRNPTISYGSILYLKIAGIKHDYDDMTLSVHNSILSLLAGDYDGDVLNIISVKDSESKIVFKDVFSPISLLIDSNNGDFNEALNLERDQVLGINNLLI